MKTSHFDSILQHGISDLQAGRFASALQYLDEADRIRPHHPTVLYNRGYCRHALGDHAGAIADQTIVVELVPDSADACFWLAVARHSMNDLMGAIRDYSAAIQLRPAYHAAYWNRSLAQYAAGRPDEGLLDADRADTIDPSVRQTCRKNAAAGVQALASQVCSGESVLLRAHHVFGLLYHCQAPSLFSVPDRDYIHDFRKRGAYHSEETAFVWRGVLHLIYENPDWPVAYCDGLDSVCRICPYRTPCSTGGTSHFYAAYKADSESALTLSDLKCGEVYSGTLLREFFATKGWL